MTLFESPPEPGETFVFFCTSGFCVVEKFSSAPEQGVGVGDKEELFIEGEGGGNKCQTNFYNQLLNDMKQATFQYKLDHLTTTKTIQRKG